MLYLRKTFSSFRYAFTGVYTLFRSEHNAKLHLVAAISVIAMAWSMRISRMEWIVLVMAIGLVWMAEAFNTAIEKLTDLAHPYQHPLAKKVKDVAAAAVLIISIAAAIVGLIVFVPYL